MSDAPVERTVIISMPDAGHRIIVGVDTHQDTHVAVDQLGVRLDQLSVPATTSGYERLARWAARLGEVTGFGVEGTGSYGAGLTRFLLDHGYRVVEVNRPDRATRYRVGKNDAIDAEMAARAILAGVAAGVPKTGAGNVEMIRVLKLAKDSAVKACTQSINQIKGLLVTAPAAVREGLSDLTSSEAKTVETQIKELVTATTPELLNLPGVGPNGAAILLITAGDNPQRLHSAAAFAALCGASPVPASSGKTNRHRLNRGGDRHGNAALHRIIIVRLRWHQPTRDYLHRRITEGKPNARSSTTSNATSHAKSTLSSAHQPTAQNHLTIYRSIIT